MPKGSLILETWALNPSYLLTEKLTQYLVNALKFCIRRQKNFEPKCHFRENFLKKVTEHFKKQQGLPTISKSNQLLRGVREGSRSWSFQGSSWPLLGLLCGISCYFHLPAKTGINLQSLFHQKDKHHLPKKRIFFIYRRKMRLKLLSVFQMA